MATSKVNEETPEISSTLLTKSLNFHGQELVKALQVEHGDKMMKYVDTKYLNRAEYHKRNPWAEFSQRSKRLRFLQFIAKKADMLFKPPNAEAEGTEHGEEMYAVMPPIEKFMVVPSNTRRRRFYDELQLGDILVGTVRSRNYPGLVGPNSSERCVLHLMCFDGKKKRYIQDLLIKAEVNNGDYNFNDLVRGYVYSHNRSTNKIVIETVLPPHTAPNKNLIASMGNERLTLGRIGIDDVPRYMKLEDQAGIEKTPEQIPSFHNPAAVENLCRVFGLPVTGCTSLMKKLANLEIPKEEYATGLKKNQMSLWAMRYHQDSNQYCKEEKLTDAFLCLNNALRIDPENSEALIDRGCLIVGMENFEKAIEDFKAALTCDPGNQLAKKYLSHAYMMLGKKFAALSEVERSYENFRSAVEYNPSNDEALSYLNAIVSVKNIIDAEKAAQQNSDSEESNNAVAKSPFKEHEPPECASTTSDVWPTASAAAWQNSDTSWLSPYANTSWPGPDSSGYPAPSSYWETVPSAWSSRWYGASSAPWPITSSTWTPAGSDGFHAPSTSSIIPSISGYYQHLRIIPEYTIPGIISQYDRQSRIAIDMTRLDQLHETVEEEIDGPMFSGTSSHSVSSASTTSSRRCHREEPLYRDDGSDDSEHNSESPPTDYHKQELEQFVEPKKNQTENKEAQTTDLNRSLSKKDREEEGPSRKDYHRKSDIVHKNDCVKKTNRASFEDLDKNSHKDSVGVTKERKVNDFRDAKKDSKKTEEESVFEIPHVLLLDSEPVDPREISVENDEESEQKASEHQSKKIEAITVTNEHKKKAVVPKKKDEGSPSEDNVNVGGSNSYSSLNRYLYLTRAMKNYDGLKVLDGVNASSAAQANRNSAVGRGNQNSPVAHSDCPSIDRSKCIHKKPPLSEKPLKPIGSQEANDLVLPKNTTVCDDSALPRTSAVPDLESVLSDVPSDSFATVNTRNSEPQSKEKMNQRKMRCDSRERSSHRHHRRHERSADSRQDDESYDIPDTSLSIRRAKNDRIVHCIRRGLKHTNKVVTSKHAAKLYFQALKDVSSEHLKYTMKRSVRRMWELR